MQPISAGFPLVSALMGVPLLTTMAIIAVRSPATALRIAFAGAVLNVALAWYLLELFKSTENGVQLHEQLSFFGMSYSVGVDGLNILFVPLTTLLTVIVLLYTTLTRFATDKRVIACVLAYETVLIGAFTAMNLMQFWLWSLLELIPVVLLSVDAGTGRMRRWVATLFLQYWGSGLLMTLAGFLFLAFGLVGSDHNLTFDWLVLKENIAYLHDETLVFILLLFGFAIRMALFPFHGWLPLLAEHGATASAPVFLVGLKLGLYAVVRFIMPLLPGVAEQWGGFVLALGLASVCYGALLALLQINLRRLLAFAAISQTGLLVVGVFCFNDYGLQGSLLLALTGGLAIAALFLSVGLVYERTRTALIPRLGGLFSRHNSLALLFLVAALSTLVLPGTPGFGSAHLLLQGVLDEYGWATAITLVIGNVGAAFALVWAFYKVFIDRPKRPYQPAHAGYTAAIRTRVLALSCGLLLVVTGYYSTPWLKLIGVATADIGQAYPVHDAESGNEALN